MHPKACLPDHKMIVKSVGRTIKYKSMNYMLSVYVPLFFDTAVPGYMESGFLVKLNIRTSKKTAFECLDMEECPDIEAVQISKHYYSMLWNPDIKLSGFQSSLIIECPDNELCFLMLWNLDIRKPGYNCITLCLKIYRMSPISFDMAYFDINLKRVFLQTLCRLSLGGRSGSLSYYRLI